MWFRLYLCQRHLYVLIVWCINSALLLYFALYKPEDIFLSCILNLFYRISLAKHFAILQFEQKKPVSNVVYIHLWINLQRYIIIPIPKPAIIFCVAFRSIVEKYMPGNLRSKIKINDVMMEHKIMFKVSQVAAHDQCLQLIQRWPLWASTIFEVKVSSAFFTA